jgi:hypothetical protein
MRGLLGLALVAGVVGVGAVALAASKDKGPKLVVVWDGTKWVYAEVRPDGLYPTNIPAPPVGRQGRVASGTYSP